MVDKITIAFVLGAVLVLGGLGPNIATMIQTAEGHGVQAQLQSRFVRIEDETFNRQSLQTGEVVTLTAHLSVWLINHYEHGHQSSQSQQMQVTDGKCWLETHQVMFSAFLETV